MLLIASGLLVVSYPYFKDDDLQLNRAAEQVLSAVIHARQVAMTRGTAGHQVSLAFTQNSLSLLENGNPINSSQSYPIVLDHNIRIGVRPNNLSFDHQGNTQARTIRLSQGDQAVTLSVNRVGYVYYE